MSKIIEISNIIKFDDNTVIFYDHDQDCCEHNYADFDQIDDIARNTDFDTENLIFEDCGHGFRFGNVNKMFFVPCYSEQNGYYSNMVDIYVNRDGDTIQVLSTKGEWINEW